MSDNNDEFYRAVPPPKSAGIILKEKPWHRLAAYLVAIGIEDSQIAKVVGHCRQAVWELRQQPWFLERVAYILHEHGGEVARRMLEEAGPLAVQKLVELMQSGDIQAETRSAVEIIRAVVGNKLNIEGKVHSLPPAQLKAEIARVQREIDLIEKGADPNTLLTAENDAKPEGS
jgi:hypothetical protein